MELIIGLAIMFSVPAALAFLESTVKKDEPLGHDDCKSY